MNINGINKFFFNIPEHIKINICSQLTEFNISKILKDRLPLKIKVYFCNLVFNFNTVP